MKKFVFVYYGGHKHDDMSQEDKDKVMEKWMAWFKSIDSHIADGGNPFGPDGKSVEASGVTAIPDDMWPAKGYTIINAESMDAATEIAKSCPMIVDGEKDATIRVYEAMPM